MKRAMVYLIAISTLLTALLSGCGEMKRPGTADPTPAPKETVSPADMMPDESDGIVNDTDGIITEDDNGGDLAERTDKDPDTDESAVARPAIDAPQSGSGMTAGTGKAAGAR